MEKTKNSYKKSGVNIALADKFVRHIAKVSKKNVGKNVGKNRVWPILEREVLF